MLLPIPMVLLIVYKI